MVFLELRPLVLLMVSIEILLLAPEFALAKLRSLVLKKALAELRPLVTMLAPVMLQQQVMPVLGQPRALEMLLV